MLLLLVLTVARAAAGPDPDAFVEVATGYAHVCGRTAAGEVACWGVNHRGQVGVSGADRVYAPRAVALGSRAVGVVAAQDHGCAWLDTGRAACWGEGSAAPRDLGLERVTGITASGTHVCARVGRREQVCFAWGAEGTLEPAALSAPIAAASPHPEWGCGVLNDGAIRCRAEGPATWRLDYASEQTWRLGVDCPAGTVESRTPAAWGCTDAEGRRQGPSVTFWPDGRVREAGALQDDVRVGPWANLDADGRHPTAGDYADGLRDGVWRVHRVDPLHGDRLLVEGAFAAEVQVGRWTFDGGAEVRFDGAGAPIGWSWAREGGVVLDVRRDEDRWWRSHRVGGAIVARAGVRVTHLPAWGLDGPGAGGSVVLDGPYEGRHGEVDVSGVLMEGRPTGRWEGAYRTGPAWAGTFVDGVPDGAWEARHPDGTTALAGTFARGIPVETWRRWHPGGALAVEGRYERGQMVGRWRWLRPDGTVAVERRFAPIPDGPGLSAGALGPSWDARTGAEIGWPSEPCEPRWGVPCAGPRRDTLMDEVQALIDVEPLLNRPGVTR